jgi:hypothetical protein
MPQNLGESAYSDKPNHPESNTGEPDKVPHDLDPSAFVENLVGNAINWAHERPALSWTMPDGRQPAVDWNPGSIGPKFTHVSVGLFRINDVAQGAKFYRRAESWTGNLAIVLDDIGEEKHGVVLMPPKLDPTIVIETKPGSQQWWYVFKTALRNASTIDRMMRSLIEAGHGDKGGSTGKTSLIRLARLPGSDPKGRGIPARIVFEDWRRRFVPDAERLFQKDGFNLPLLSPRPVLTASNAVLILQNGEDPLLDWLSANGQTLEPAPNSQGWIAIRCPWHGEHTGGAQGGTGYRSAQPNGVHCYHGACAHRQPHDFFAHWMASGAPVLPEAGPVDRDEALIRLAGLLDLSDDIRQLHIAKEPRTSANAMPLAMALARARVPWADAGQMIAYYWLGDERPAMLALARVIAWRADLMMLDARAEYDAIADVLKETNIPKPTEAAINAFLASMEPRE